LLDADTRAEQSPILDHALQFKVGVRIWTTTGIGIYDEGVQQLLDRGAGLIF
jgi:hypothetical protein